MPDFLKHLRAMERIEAMETLTKLKVSDYPKMNDDSRNSFHKAIIKKAFPFQKVHSFDDIEKALGL